MVWGCFLSKGVGNLVFIDDIMDKFLYLDIVRDNLRESARIMGMDQFIFQQDNDPKHTSKLIKWFLEENNIEIMEWPSQSLDLNPIEHVWAYMKRELGGKNFKTRDDLKSELLSLWSNIPQGFIDKLIRSIPKRVQEVIKAGGRSIKY